MTEFQVKNPNYEVLARKSFAGQAMMTELGVEIVTVAPGAVTLSMPYDARFTQQHGFLHGGVVASCMDTVCGFAAFTLMPPDAGVLTVEYKTNFLSAARGERFKFTGEVVKPGSTITVAEAKAHAVSDRGEKLIATLTATLMTVMDRDEVKG